MLPAFAKPIVEARAAGKRPGEIVIVSDGEHGLHRRCPRNAVVRIEPTQRPDAFAWAFLADLDVEITLPMNWKRTRAIVNAILPARPNYLRVWWLDTGDLIRIRWCGITHVRLENSFVCADATHR